ncbi:hypothetical protein DN752_13220 [Echinicola strongylocentroti]|uniref:Uncharacterized protein n=1 Tax=Echinicola strongylocentroti TaxID=1795355 RepID=A0A2Z4IKC9_9BACT|nr:hypothetical protein [Echinicola strongylocentroti]AWW31006.1 hypothetical protein DN752_13220 [Echinicola strongylocentroti]
MKQLDNYALESKISDFFSNIKYAGDYDVELTKTKHLMNFLGKQLISKRILTRIEKDYDDLKKKIDLYENGESELRKEILSLIEEDSFNQGAFGYFTIVHVLDRPNNNGNYQFLHGILHKYYDIALRWSDEKSHFSDLVLEPFEDLIDWYLNDAQTENPEDYYSQNEFEKVREDIDKIFEELQKQGKGQEIIYDDLMAEFEELKELISTLNKKNLGQLLKGKLMDWGISQGVTSIADEVIKQLDFVG